MNDALSAATPPAGPLLVRGLRVLTGDGQVHADGALVVKGERLEDVGPAAAVAQRHPGLRAVDAAGWTAIPGLVNAHTHVAMGFFRGLGHGRDQMIETFLFPAEKSLTPELLEPLSWSYLVDGLRSGVTCVGDHYYFASGIARAIDRLGLRGVVGETVADLGGAFPGRAGWDAWKNELAKWSHSARVRPAIAPHAADTVSPALLKELADFATANKLPLHMHLAQSSGERQRVAAREGMTPVAYAEKCGALTERTLAVHLVAIDDADLVILKSRGVTAGICPASQIIYEELAPLARILTAGIPVALGTDCAASNDAADLLAEMKLAALLAKDRGADAALREPAQVLAMGSRNGARALGLEHEIGTLAPGKAADVVFLKGDLGTEPSPRPDVNLIYSLRSRNVRHVMVGGRWVLWDGALQTVDEAALAREYDTAVAEINRRLGAKA